MLKPDQVLNKATAVRPNPNPPAPAAKPVPQPERCALCGQPCSVVTMVMEPGWQVQVCECSGRQRRKTDVADKRLA